MMSISATVVSIVEFSLTKDFTFPLAVGAQALLKYANYSKSVNGQYFYIWNIISIFELIVASMMIIYVFVNMMFFVHNNVIKDKK